MLLVTGHTHSFPTTQCTRVPRMTNTWVGERTPWERPEGMQSHLQDNLPRKNNQWERPPQRQGEGQPKDQFTYEKEHEILQLRGCYPGYFSLPMEPVSGGGHLNRKGRGGSPKISSPERRGSWFCKESCHLCRQISGEPHHKR